MATVVHITVVTRRYYYSGSDYLYKDAATRRNLCGAPPTQYDVTAAEARKILNGTSWQVCTACRERAVCQGADDAQRELQGQRIESFYGPDSLHPRHDPRCDVYISQQCSCGLHSRFDTEVK